MQKSTKAALAALTGAGLLLGGAGSLAYWADDESVPSTTITSGSLDLLDDGCASWQVDAADVDLSTYRIVPGETLTRTCTFTLDLVGAGLNAGLAFNTPTAGTGTLADELDYAATYSLDGAAAVPVAGAVAGTLTAADDAKEVDVTFSVELPFDGNEVAPGIDNDSNNGPEYGNGLLAATLDALTITLTQTA